MGIFLAGYIYPIDSITFDPITSNSWTSIRGKFFNTNPRLLTCSLLIFNGFAVSLRDYSDVYRKTLEVQLATIFFIGWELQVSPLFYDEVYHLPKGSYTIFSNGG